MIIALLSVSVSGESDEYSIVHSLGGVQPSLNKIKRATQVQEPTLNGTAWTALEIAFNSTTQQLQPIPLNHPITLTFDSTQISGSTGCNRYFGPFDSLSENSFSTSGFGTTRKYCGEVMEQERNYTGFLSGRTFFHEISIAEDNAYELVLFDNVAGPGGELVQAENIVARFRTLIEDVK